MLLLHGYPASINVLRILWLCEELGLEVGLVERGTPACPVNDLEFVRKNTFEREPQLVDGSFSLSEAMMIALREQMDRKKWR